MCANFGLVGVRCRPRTSRFLNRHPGAGAEGESAAFAEF